MVSLSIAEIVPDLGGNLMVQLVVVESLFLFRGTLYDALVSFEVEPLVSLDIDVVWFIVSSLEILSSLLLFTFIIILLKSFSDEFDEFWATFVEQIKLKLNSNHYPFKANLQISIIFKAFSRSSFLTP